MGELSEKRKWLAGLTDKALVDYIRTSDDPYLLDAVRELDIRASKTLIKISRWLCGFTIALFILTFALVVIEIRLFISHEAN